MHALPKYLRQRVLRALDDALWCWTPDAELPPSGGWLLPAREALGMSTRRLGRQIGVSKSAVTSAERAEREGAITLATLRRYAAALDCKLVYALVPKAGSLEKMFRQRADAMLKRRMGRMLPGRAKPSLPLRKDFRNAALARPRRLKLWR